VIHVDRERENDGQVIRPAEPWFKRAAELTDQAIAEGEDHQVADHYRHDEVKKALEALFYDKCAYCESRPTPSSSWDVEHYRPKGRVAEREGHPGYYWLAYTWENLYPACTFCNQNRKDKPRYGEPEELAAAGKLDQFPLEDESQRAMTPDDDLNGERPCLLDPCADDDPEQHLTYDIMGQILPAASQDRQATETIRICHLTRRRLRDDRARTIIQMSKAVRNLALARAADNALAEQLMHELIAGFVAPDALYAGAARAVLRDPEAFVIEE
jgi:uncharacterized protein (TIGR02646 family)